MSVIQNSGVAQICFPSPDGMSTLCNYVVRGGREIWSNSGKYLKLPRFKKSSKKKEKTSLGDDVISKGI